MFKDIRRPGQVLTFTHVVRRSVEPARRTVHPQPWRAESQDAEQALVAGNESLPIMSSSSALEVKLDGPKKVALNESKSIDKEINSRHRTPSRCTVNVPPHAQRDLCGVTAQLVIP